MKALLKNLRYFAVIVAGGLVISVLLVLVTSGFKLNPITLSTYLFVLSFIPSITGGIMIVSRFMGFKKELIATQWQIDMEDEEAKTAHIDNSKVMVTSKIYWSYLLLISGIVMLAISAIIVFNFD